MHATPENTKLYFNEETQEPVVPDNLHSCTLPRVDCPRGAYCFGGYVRSCHDPNLLEIDSSSTKCVLSASGIELQDRAISALSTLSVDYSCNCWGLFRFTSSRCKISKDAIKPSSNGGHPLFKLRSLTAFMNEHSPSGDVSVTDDEIATVSTSPPLTILSDGSDETFFVGLKREYANRFVKVSSPPFLPPYSPFSTQTDNLISSVLEKKSFLFLATFRFCQTISSATVGVLQRILSLV